MKEPRKITRKNVQNEEILMMPNVFSVRDFTPVVKVDCKVMKENVWNFLNIINLELIIVEFVKNSWMIIKIIL